MNARNPNGLEVVATRSMTVILARGLKIGDLPITYEYSPNIGGIEVYLTEAISGIEVSADEKMELEAQIVHFFRGKKLMFS